MNKAEDLIRQMNTVYNRTNGLYDKWFQLNNLNSYYIHTLYAMYMELDLSQKEISESLKIPRQTVNNTVKVLEKEGYIKLVQDPSDGRRRKIVFTDQGVKYAQTTLFPILELDRKIVEQMGVEKYAQFIALFGEYANVIEVEMCDE